MDEDMDISFEGHVTPRSVPSVSSQPVLIYDWTLDELKTLCKRIKEQTLRISKVTAFPYNKTEAKVNWQMVAFGNHDPDECKTKWSQVLNNIRTFRTLNEVVDDAEQWLEKGPKTCKEAKVKGKTHPDKPTKPPSVFLRYMIEHMPKLKAKCPELPHREIVSKLGESYKMLSQKKMDQYRAQFAADMEDYKVRLDDFYHNHPDIAPSKSLVIPLPRGTSGLSFYTAEKLKDPKYAECSKEELRNKWKKLKDEKKVYYIEMALAAHKKSKGSISLMEKPGRDVLNRDERCVYDRFLGRPDKVPQTGFNLFKSLASAAELQELTQTDKLKELQLRWNSMSRADQNKFNNEVKIMKQQYDRKMAEYLDKLQKREQLLDSPNMLNSCSGALEENGDANSQKRARSEELSSSPEKRSKPKKIKAKVTALSWYQESHLEEWQQLNPDLSDAELLEAIEDQFSQLSEKKRAKWTRKAAEENERRGVV